MAAIPIGPERPGALDAVVEREPGRGLAHVAETSDEFSMFVRTRTPALLRSAYLLTGDQHLAEDLVQTALAHTHRSWHRLRDKGNVEAYTRKVMYHHQISIWRRRRVAESFTGELPARAGGDDHAANVALRLSLRVALLKLSPRQRAVLVLRFFEDRSEAETAELLGVSIGTVKSQTSKALVRMRALAPELAIAEGTQP
jgi:RNA polymerase sigma-70 factor (sigma-E family)